MPQPVGAQAVGQVVSGERRFGDPAGNNKPWRDAS